MLEKVDIGGKGMKNLKFTNRMSINEPTKETTSSKYQNMLKDQIKQAGSWLIEHADDIVSDVKNISDFKITIDLENGCKLPTIKFMQENCFWNYDEWEKRKEIVGEK